MSDRVAAFEVLSPKTGHRWMVYADGQIRGFGPSVVVINRIPQLMLKAAEEAQRIRQEAAIKNSPEALEAATINPNWPICERCGAQIGDPCLTDKEAAACELPDFCFPSGRVSRS